ncbi:MAG TPA: N-acetylmuramic acid 6-phosphate etherase [Verrucomicrobiota bacterium]|nr:N-acetylmuramic acid 6-phosphate etherase [Verrucomicrobiota bacterium]HNT13930.1 N-acetylmuramic acid 6-phosphate etherase [Verrucomicrobiota bacterium]
MQSARRRKTAHLPPVLPDAVMGVIRTSKPSPTEQRNPRSRHLDRLPIRAAVELMLTEEAKVTRKLLRQTARLTRAVGMVARAFRHGGRLIYVGAGTSGRLGVLDASECPPTFRTDPAMVQGIIAGGEKALRVAVEGAEDDSGAGAKSIQRCRVSRPDVVVGIAASGMTRFVWGALHEAKRRGAKTVLICFNPYLVIPPRYRPSLVLATDLGPEVLTGSTRLKAGTATKLILNLLTTLALVRTGRVLSNLMVEMNPSNAKLRQRAIGIVQALTGDDAATARAALVKHRWVIRAAVGRPPRHRRSG